MKKIFLAALLFSVISGAFLAGAWSARKSALAGDSGRKILYYVDPMNPSHTSDKPGLAPCGMKMEPVYADKTGGTSRSTLPGTVKLDVKRQQLIGIRTGKAEKKAVTHTLRLLAKVEPDATRSFQVTAPAEGWITKAMPVTVGARVQKHQTLAMLYSPTFISAGLAFRNALEYQDRMKTNDVERAMQRNGLAEYNVKQFADSLRNIGVSDRQIEDMIRTRKYSDHIEVVSPAEGVMTVRNVSEGQRFEKGVELYRVADLSRVWVVADVFNKDAPLVPPGAQARVTVPAQNLAMPAQLSEALPQFDSVTRTLKLRFEADNPDVVLKPDMLVDVEVDVTLPDALVVFAEAVLDSGLRKTIFVDLGDGYFEPRTVETGWRVGDYVQITKGLMAAEPIVISGNFLIDSESRMKLAASGVHGQAQVDPVCGMAVDEANARAAKRLSERNGTAYFFCNEGCKQEFDADSDKFLKKVEKPEPTPVPVVASEPEIDPVCGMKVTPEKARAASRLAVHEGKTYFFCNDSCKEEFLADPAKFLKPATLSQAGHDQSHR